MWNAYRFSVSFQAAQLHTLHQQRLPQKLRLRLKHYAGAMKMPMAEFGASVYLGGPWDWEIKDGGKSRCTEMIDRVVKNEIHYVQFVPTFYWWDQGPDLSKAPPGFDPSCTNYTLSTYYCYSRFNVTEVAWWCYTRKDGRCPEVTSAEIDDMVEGIGHCMKYAVDKGLNLAVNARVDDGRSLGGWRNALDFIPNKRYGKYSYEEAILYPLADALGKAADPNTELSFTLQGEMGATVFYHPLEWIQVIADVRERIQRAAAYPAPGLSAKQNILIGIAVNNNKLFASVHLDVVDGREYLNLLKTDFPKKDFDYPAIHSLFEQAADFIAISAYIPVSTPKFQPCELEGLLQRMDEEFAYFNISVKDLVDTYGRQIHYVEYGVGGGVSGTATTVAAKTAEEAGYFPFFGISGVYSCDKDPFGGCTPNAPNPVREYRQYFYNQSAVYFEQGGCDYHGVTIAYIWPLGSFDVLGVYDEGPPCAYCDPVVTNTINTINKKAEVAKSQA